MHNQSVRFLAQLKPFWFDESIQIVYKYILQPLFPTCSNESLYYFGRLMLKQPEKGRDLNPRELLQYLIPVLAMYDMWMAFNKILWLYTVRNMKAEWQLLNRAI